MKAKQGEEEITNSPTRRTEASRRRDLLIEGLTCWRCEHARRVAHLVDGEAYFEAVAAAIESAESQILMLGWDFHSRVRLRRSSEPDGSTEELAARLDSAVDRNRRLQVYVLGWDFAMIYALEREALPLYRLGLRSRRRVHFHLDDGHPPGASHHQKIVVIDDALAFVGGFDLTSCRWDTREHQAADSRRSDPGFPEYDPFHDVQLAVDGNVARALGELARDRWWRATGERLAAPRAGGDPWPEGLAPDLREVEVGISRTEPSFRDRNEVREVEALHVQSIRAAQRSIYIENQYLTAARIGEVLAERLREADGPEVVIVAPRVCSGWLEESTMGVMRARLLDRLRDADRSGRLRVLYPVVPELGHRTINVHAKVTVVDDRLLRVGSANLSNRSMGLDTECDLAVEAGEDEQTRAAIERFRNDLLGEHLGASAEQVRQTIAAEGSLLAGIEVLRGGPRTLEPVTAELPAWAEELVPETTVFDPEKPVDIETMLASFLPDAVSEEHRPLLWRLGLSVLALALLAIAWRWTPLSDWITPEKMVFLSRWLQQDPAGPLVATGAIAIGSCLMVPVTVMIVTAALVFGWLLGFATALAGALAGTAAGYGIGRLLWRDAIRRLGGRRLNRLSRALARRGVTAVALVRLVPVAPFTVVNLVAGASHIRLRDCLLGTLLGMAPGALALTIFASSARRAILEPGWSTVLSVLVLAGLLWWGFRRLRRHLEGRDASGIRDGDPRSS